MNPVESAGALTLTYATALWVLVAIVGAVLGVVWASLQWAVGRHLKKVDELAEATAAIEKAFVSQCDMKSAIDPIEKRVEFIAGDYVSKGELRTVFEQLDRSIVNSGLTMRDALARVHTRVDDIFKELFSSGGRKGP
jgi:hypothetical protein